MQGILRIAQRIICDQFQDSGTLRYHKKRAGNMLQSLGAVTLAVLCLSGCTTERMPTDWCQTDEIPESSNDEGDLVKLQIGMTIDQASESLSRLTLQRSWGTGQWLSMTWKRSDASDESIKLYFESDDVGVFRLQHWN